MHPFRASSRFHGVFGPRSSPGERYTVRNAVPPVRYRQGLRICFFLVVQQRPTSMDRPACGIRGHGAQDLVFPGPGGTKAVRGTSAWGGLIAVSVGLCGGLGHGTPTVCTEGATRMAQGGCHGDGIRARPQPRPYHNPSSWSESLLHLCDERILLYLRTMHPAPILPAVPQPLLRPPPRCPKALQRNQTRPPGFSRRRRVRKTHTQVSAVYRRTRALTELGFGQGQCQVKCPKLGRGVRLRADPRAGETFSQGRDFGQASWDVRNGADFGLLVFCALGCTRLSVSLELNQGRTTHYRHGREPSKLPQDTCNMSTIWTFTPPSRLVSMPPTTFIRLHTRRHPSALPERTSLLPG